jgi:hypothetical protein
VAGARLPVSPLYVHPALSPDGAYLFAAVSQNIGDIVMFDGPV